MNPTDPLANLADIQIPDPVSAWPPAPGWWILAALVLAVLIGVPLWLIKRHRKRAYRREALAQLQLLQNRKDELSATEMASALSGLLKQVAITLFGRQHTASLNGEAWLQFLDAKGNTSDFTQGPGRVLGNDIYRPDASVELDTLFTLSKKWIEKQS